MALMGRKPATDRAEVEIPQLLDDPQFAQASELLAAFQDHHQRLEREKNRLDLEAHFGDRPASGDSISERDLRTRLLALRAEPPIAAASSVSNRAERPAASTPAIALGLEILNGAPATPVPDHRARILAIERQIVAIREAIFDQAEVCRTLADELSFRYSKQLKPAWDAIQIEMYRSAQELARGVRRFREFRNAITAAGIQPRSDILAMPNVRAPLLLGDETNWDSEIAGWRRILEGMGIL